MCFLYTMANLQVRALCIACISCTPDDIVNENVLTIESADENVLDGATTGISCALCTLY